MSGMIQAIKNITDNLINIVYPLHCAVCKKSLDPLNKSGLCGFCAGSIRRNPKPYCRSCGRSVSNARYTCAECARMRPSFDAAYSACLYEGVLKELIHLFKYNGKLMLSGILTKLMADFINENRGIIDGIDVVTFVPLGSRDLRKRGYNQSRILATGVSGQLDLPVLDTLEKTVPTKHQNELSRAERLRNLQGAFRLKKRACVKNLKLLLIDDVMTTGATLNECSRVLSGSSTKEIRCLTLSRGII